ncbi:MAG: ATP-binding protein [Rhodothermaceae bacterium]
MYRDSYLINKIRKSLPIPIFETTDLALCVTDSDGIIVTVNNAFCSLTGFEKKELVNKSFTILVGEEDRTKALKDHEDFILNDIFIKKESHIYTKENVKVTTRETNVKFNDSDFIKYRLTSFTDASTMTNGEYIKSILFRISQIVHNTDDLQEIYSKVHDMISTIMPADNLLISRKDKNGKHLVEYNSYENQLQDSESFNKEQIGFIEYLENRRNSELIVKKQIEKLIEEEKILPLTTIPQLVLSVPLTAKGKNFGVIILQSYTDINAYCESKKQIMDFIATQLSRVLERKIYEEELIDARNRAIESEKTKSAFLSQMSHEIRTPLNAILSFSNLIKSEIEENITSEIAECFEMIDRGGRRLIRTFDLILNTAGIQKGDYKPEYTKISLVSDIIRPLISRYVIKASEKSLALSLIDNAVSPAVEADFCSLNQVFINLIENAIKYTEFGKIDIIVDYTPERKLRVEIIDTGIGIDENFLPHIFSNFTQEETGYTRKYDGNGLGLAVVKAYAEINNLTISVKSKKGEGTKFTIIFN